MLAPVERQRGKAEDGIGLIDRADRFHPRGVFRQPRAIDQPGGAVVAGACVDLVELDHRPSLSVNTGAVSRSCREGKQPGRSQQAEDASGRPP